MSENGTGQLLSIRDLHVAFPGPGRGVLRGVDLDVGHGEIVAVVGETGSGKTTLGRTIMGLVSPSSGSIVFAGREIAGLRGRARRKLRREGSMQLVFQDPLRSLDPTVTVADTIVESLAIAGTGDRGERRARAAKALELVGLDPGLLDRVPGRISGGQRQRVAIARALVPEPQLLICDEPVSALDASSRASILALLRQLRDETDTSMVVISHDLASMPGFADRVAVLCEGVVVEVGSTAEIFAAPKHPYTRLLLEAAAVPEIKEFTYVP
ncbi:MAG TPA: ATP-binding cassette domain-containing protein [Solirubrobacterales bacterium]|nr:ATP-binding cassette domain-containing protein [Solirubrobacterales bacterium]